MQCLQYVQNDNKQCTNEASLKWPNREKLTVQSSMVFQSVFCRPRIYRRTHYGFGMPPEDLQLFHKKIRCDRTTMTWNCLQCTFQRARYNWSQVYGEIRASR